MGIVERKEREREEMRELILEAARKLFLAQGFDKTSIRNIAEAIEYSPATIYLYYKDKNELLYSLHEAGFRKMMEQFSIVATVQDPFEKLVAIGNQYLKFAIENPELYDLMFIMDAPMETLSCREEEWDEGARSFEFLRTTIAECITAGHFKNTLDVESASLTIWSFMHGLLSLHLRKRLTFLDDNREMERIQDSFKLFVEMIKSSM
ncbi:TetR/AcrR family transcriptional regulator [Dyadobacter subterraneus]|uniref:TetR/AcrR family transcriptional regulator n=1 Tax=Dyadobacter subterraneus TaxID=2773304 RepID=A0ABR9WLP8_9BACT|nr:TetR/AcrR family transcriptional regulator [Dyadobacter subterraneus]MBE9465291.1 TetR/AcrR family transcriptional regulator [Dyadobacter subterraneus]